MSKSPSATLTTSNLASTLRDAAEHVVDATASSAKTLSAALPDNMPQLAASLPAVIPFVSDRRARRRSATVRRWIIVGAIVACVAGAAIVLRQRAQRRSIDAIDG